MAFLYGAKVILFRRCQHGCRQKWWGEGNSSNL